MKICSFLLFGSLLLTCGTVNAQTACPPGMTPYGVGVCGYDNSQQQEPTAQLQEPSPQPTPQEWEDHYGAIATDEPRGAMGVSTDMPDRQSAENVAMENCRAKGGVNCTTQISYGNQCVAMVVGGKIFNVNSGPTVTQATEKGMKLCTPVANDCHVYYSACSLPERIQ